jgi:aminomethyltransferase
MGAKMTGFGGWDMPVEYPKTGGIIAEHMAVRTAVGLFDVSHMGDILIQSAGQAGGALAAVQHISMNDASQLAIGQAQYSALLYPQGTFVDDVLVHRTGEEEYLLVINAGTREKDSQWVCKNTSEFPCTVRDLSDAYAQLAIQGPRAAELLQTLTDADLSKLKKYWFTWGSLPGLPRVMIARTGYTGEDGFEIYLTSDAHWPETVWNCILESGKMFGLLPCGLGARNTLRLEACLALYGHEISERINVWEARLERFCRMDKGDFIGRAALERGRAAGVRRVLAGLEMLDRGIARDDYKIFDQGGSQIGYVTSGSPAPFLKKNIALAYLLPEHAAIGQIVFVEVREQVLRAQVVPTPFYKRPWQ